MKLRILPVTMAATLVLFPSQSLLAAPFFNRSNPDTVRTARVHLISFQVRNEAHEAMTFKAGEQSFTLKTGETLAVKLPLGTPLMAETATAHYAAGALLATVGKDLQGNTLVFG